MAGSDFCRRIAGFEKVTPQGFAISAAKLAAIVVLLSDAGGIAKGLHTTSVPLLPIYSRTSAGWMRAGIRQNLIRSQIQFLLIIRSLDT